MSFGERIRYVKGKLSRENFGYMLGVHRNTVNRWENNETMPQGEAIIQLYELFSININWLFTGSGDPYLEGLDQPGES